MTDAATATSPSTVIAAAADEATKIYGSGDTQVTALDHVTCEFARGQFTAIMGPSGSGKSTLMHCLAGLDRLTSGAVSIAGIDLSTLDERKLTQLRRDQVGFVFQAFNLIPTLSALENITLPLDLGGRKPDEAWVDTVVTTVGLADRLTHRPSELSGGQQQRVAVARALTSRPQIIFADEPTGNLDSRTGTEILSFMRKAVDELRQTIVMVTHDPSAASYSDRVLFLNDGRIVDQMFEPTAAKVLDKMKSLGGDAGDGQTMFRIALKGILARKRRLFMTSLIIVIGVAFISGTAVLSDLLSRSVNDLVSEAYKGIDVVVRSHEAEENPFSAQPLRKPIPADVQALVREAKGVRAAEGVIQANPQMLDKAGKPISAFGPPVLALNWLGDSPLVSGHLTSGHGPRTADEAVMDFKTAEDLGFEIGDKVTTQFKQGAAVFTIVGIGGIGEDGKKTTGSKLLQIQTARLQQLTGLDGQFNYVSVAADAGVSQRELRATIEPLLPADLEARTGREFIAENQADIATLLNTVETLVSAFGYLAAFVAVFVIYNIFSILIAQRTRELALLRAVGASRSQILGSVMFEALVVGLIAAVLGLAAGYGLAVLLKGALGGLLTITSGPPHLTSGAVITSLVVGVLATVLSAIIPAVRATRIAPVAAMSETALETGRLSWTRKILGFGFIAVAGASIGYAVQPSVEAGLQYLGVGSVLLFVGLVMIGPLFAGPISRIIGRPLPWLRGAPGRLARDNASRNPKRTTATGVALTIGVAVVTVIAVLASSFKFSLVHTFETQLKGDLIVSSGFGGGGFDTDLAGTVAKVLGVDVVTQLRFGTGCSLDSAKGKEVAANPTVGRDTDSSTCRAGDSAAPPGESIFLVGIDPATFFQLVDVGNVVPSKDALDDDEIAVQDTVLKANNWRIGQKVHMWFSQVGDQVFRIASTYDKPFGGGGNDQYVVNLPTFDRVSNPAFQLTNSIYVKVDPDSSVSSVQHEIEKVVEPVAPAAEVQNISSFVRDQTKQLEGFLNIIYVLLFLAIIVAVFGISITMSLSIYERTRELGLLRAIGMARGQMRTSVRWEAAVISLFGTLLGLGTGVLLSIALVQGFSDQGIVLDLPWVTIVIIAIGGAIAGLLAARRPAKRAAGLDILDAIAAV